MPRFFFFFVQRAVWAACLVACGPTELVVDAGPAADAGGPAAQITIESEPALALSFAEEAEIAVRYTIDGEPVAGVPIRFALEGAAHDATVSALSLSTDADGRVETSVIAGSVAAAFRVRVSGERAAPAYVNVSISNQGFGALVAHAEYVGRRTEEATRRILSLYSDTTCDPPAGLPAFPDRMATLDDPEEVQARWGALPAGLSYTLVGRVEGPSGATLATACVDGVEVVRDDEVYATLDFRDAHLVPDGTYDVDVELSPAASIGRVMARAEDGGGSLIDGAGARLYLDALEAELTDRGDTVTADALALERVSGVPDADLATRLADAMVGPEVALLSWLARLTARLAVIRLGGPLDLYTVLGTLQGTWMVEALEVGAVGDPDAPPVVLDPAALSVDYAPELSVRWAATADLLRIDALTMTLPLGTLVSATIDAESAGLGSTGALLLEGAGCDQLAGWVADSATVGPTCDAACAAAACVRALDEVMEATRSAALAVDDTLDEVTIEGSVAGSDADGDLTVDALEGRGLSGQWIGPLGLEADSLSANVVGTRVSFE